MVFHGQTRVGKDKLGLRETAAELKKKLKERKGGD